MKLSDEFVSKITGPLFITSELMKMDVGDQFRRERHELEDGELRDLV